jgi:hypothetical protein
MNNKSYVAPELEFVGEASEIVQGVMWVGTDPGGESLVQEMEFESD